MDEESDEARTQVQEKWVFNNKIKQSNKNHPKGDKQAGRERERENSLHSQHNKHTTKDNRSAQDYRHQEAK